MKQTKIEQATIGKTDNLPYSKGKKMFTESHIRIRHLRISQHSLQIKLTYFYV